MKLIRFLMNVIINIFGHKPKGHCAKPSRFDFAFGLPQNKERTNHMVEATITNEQKIGVTLTPKTATGKPAKVQAGSVKFSVLSGESTVVQDPANELAASLVSSDNPGDTQILVEADADIGEGVETISDTIALHVAGANAANLGVALGNAEPK